MLTGQGMLETGNLPLGMCSALQVDLCHGGAESSSTAEAEYVALSSVAQECVWMRRLSAELGNPLRAPTIVK